MGESQTLQIENVHTIQGECKRLEDNFIKAYKEQGQEIEKQIQNNLNQLKATENVVKEMQGSFVEQGALTEKRINDLENGNQDYKQYLSDDMSKHFEQVKKSIDNRTTEIEDTLKSYYQTVNKNSDDIKKLNEELTTLGMLTQDNLIEIRSNISEDHNYKSSIKEELSEFRISVQERLNETNSTLTNVQEKLNVMNVNLNNCENFVTKLM